MPALVKVLRPVIFLYAVFNSLLTCVDSLKYIKGLLRIDQLLRDKHNQYGYTTSTTLRKRLLAVENATENEENGTNVIKGKEDRGGANHLRENGNKYQNTTIDNDHFFSNTSTPNTNSTLITLSVNDTLSFQEPVISFEEKSLNGFNDTNVSIQENLNDEVSAKVEDNLGLESLVDDIALEEAIEAFEKVEKNPSLDPTMIVEEIETAEELDGVDGTLQVDDSVDIEYLEDTNEMLLYNENGTGTERIVEVDDDELEEKLKDVNELNELAEASEYGAATFDDDEKAEKIEVAKEAMEEIDEIPTPSPTSYFEEVEKLEVIDELVNNGAITVDDDKLEGKLVEIEDMNEIAEEYENGTISVNDEMLAEKIYVVEEVEDEIEEKSTSPPTSYLEEVEDLEILDELANEGIIAVDDDYAEGAIQEVEELNEIVEEYENGTLIVDDDDLAEKIEVVEEAREEIDEIPTFPPTSYLEEVEDLEILEELANEGVITVDDDYVEGAIQEVEELNEIAEEYENGTLAVDDDDLAEKIEVVEEAREEIGEMPTFPPTSYLEEVEDLEILEELVNEGAIEVDDDYVEGAIQEVEEMNEIVKEYENGNVTVDDDELVEMIDVVEEAEGEINAVPTFPPTSLKEVVEGLEVLDKIIKEEGITVDDDVLEENLEEVEEFEAFEKNIQKENPSSGPASFNEIAEKFEEETEMEKLEVIEEAYMNGTVILDDDDFIDVLEEVKEYEEEEVEVVEEVVINDDDENRTYVSTDDDPVLEGEDTDPFTKSNQNLQKTNGIKVTGFMIVISILAMIFTSYQVSENPDGAFASICRLCASVASCLCKVILAPFRYLFRRFIGKSTTHHPISSVDYREPYRGSSSNFVIS